MNAIQSWPAAVWRRVAPANIMVTLAMCLVFGALIVAAIYFVRDPQAIFWSKAAAVSGSTGLPGAVKAVPLVGAATLGPNDPAVRFSQTRVGHVLFSKAGSDNCVRVLFDNRTGLYYEAPDVFCGQTADQLVEADSPNRLLALKKSFQR